MKTKEYYFPINAINLSTYLGSAIITPKRYIKGINDVQDNFNNHLLLSTKMGLEDSDVCLLLVLTEDEQARIEKINETLSLYNGGLNKKDIF
jgi:hypothetical protein